MGFRTVRIIFVSTLFLSVLAVSCKKESFNTGAGVTFSMSNKGVDTKATYGSLVKDKDNILQMIDWVEGDGIAICCYCQDAESPVSKKQGPVTYSVASVSTENHQSIAKVRALSDESGLKWGGNHNHNFYCVYPAVGEGTVTNEFGFDDNNNCVVTGSIPVTQSQQEDLKPYMLMYGKAESRPEPKVDVDFYPLTTCIDFKITFDVPMTVTNIALISSDGKNLSGEFIYNIDTDKCTSTTGKNKVMVSYGAGQACTKITELTFKLFVNPSDDIVEPYFAVNYIDTEGVWRYTKTQLKYKEGVSGTFKFLKSHKTNVTGIIVKEGFKITNFDGMELCAWSEETLDLPVEDELKTVFSLDKDSFEFSNDGESKELVITAYNYYERFPDVHYPVNSIPVVTCSDSSWVTICDPVQQTDKTKWKVTLEAKKNTPIVYDINSQKLREAEDVTFDYSGGESANCYVVHAPGTYQFAPKKGKTGDSVIPSSVEVLWSDVENLIKVVSFSNEKITFKVDRNLIEQSNSVIAAYDKNNVILWSWHIWITPRTDLNNLCLGYCKTGGKKINSYSKHEADLSVSVDGASQKLEISLEQGGQIEEGDTVTEKDHCVYYQWGRKDPLYPEIRSKQVSGTQNIITSIQEAQYFYLNRNDANWCSDNSALWSAPKTMYDPCPPGYRVPTANERAKVESSTTYCNKSYFIKSDGTFEIGELRVWASTIGQFNNSVYASFATTEQDAQQLSNNYYRRVEGYSIIPFKSSN